MRDDALGPSAVAGSIVSKSQRQPLMVDVTARKVRPSPFYLFRKNKDFKTFIEKTTSSYLAEP